VRENGVDTTTSQKHHVIGLRSVYQPYRQSRWTFPYKQRVCWKKNSCLVRNFVAVPSHLFTDTNFAHFFLHSEINVWSFSFHTRTRVKSIIESYVFREKNTKESVCKWSAFIALRLFCSRNDAPREVSLLFYCRAFSHFISLLLPQWSRNLKSDAPLSNGPCQLARIDNDGEHCTRVRKLRWT